METNDTRTNRRLLLKSLLVSSVCPLIPALGDASMPHASGMASPFRNKDDGNFGVAVMAQDGSLRQVEPLPGRGHSCIFNRITQQLVTFARRPGRFIHVLELSASRPPLEVASVAGRHFYGHGCFNKSGTRLYATENDYAAARGIVGVYDVTNNYQRIDEFPSYGVGPHDMFLMQDGTTLLLANGGIETHPSTGREKLNLLEMQSNLAFIDSRSGQLVHSIDVHSEYPQLSLRHLSKGQQAGESYIAGQYQGAAEDLPPLIGTITAYGRLVLWNIPKSSLVRLKSYISSIHAIPGTSFVAITSSRGGVVLIWDTQNKRVERMIELRDVSGITTLASTLHISDGTGGLYSAQHGVLRQLATSGEGITQWDNHLMAMDR